MKTRNFLGTTVGEIGFGGWAIGGAAYGPTDDATSRAAIRTALECGVTFFDTSDMYGRSEELLSELPRGVFVATKVGHGTNFSPDPLRRAVEASLGRLRRDALDLVQLHNPPLDVIREGRAMEVLRRSGMARHVGVSIQNAEEARAAVEAGADSVQMVYNYLVDTPLPTGVAIIAREPLARGLLTGKFRDDATFGPGDVRSRYPKETFAGLVAQVEEFKSMLAPGLTPARAALKFVLARPQVIVTIPGAKTPEQVRENCSASDGATDIFEFKEGLGGDA